MINIRDTNIYEDAIQKWKVKNILNHLKNTYQEVEDIRFRPIDWQCKAIVHVPGFSLENNKFDPCLYRRVFADINSPKKIDGLVGLEARRTYLEYLEVEENKDLLEKLKFEDNLREIIEESFKRLKSKRYKFETLKNKWNRHKEQVKNLNIDDHQFFKKVIEILENEGRWKQLISSYEQREDKIGLINKVEDTYEHYLKLYDQWCRYYENLDKKWESYRNGNHLTIPEVAIPVKYGGKLLGILSFYMDSEKLEAEMKDLYSNLLAIVCMKDKVELLKSIQKVTDAMVTKSDLEKIAKEIVKGIRTAFVGYDEKHIFPILYLCEEPIDRLDDVKDFVNQWKNQYQKREKPQDEEDYKLWKKEESLGNGSIRENGLGRKAIKQWQDEAKNPSAKAKNYFTISPDVDNPDSATGDARALEQGIRTTGCIPLILDDKVYGLLYIHFLNRHFFTENELEALETFGSHAAIAIKNYKLVGESYDDLYGHTLLDRLNKLEG